MNEQMVSDVFSVYEALKDSIKVTRRSINKDFFELHNRTIFLGEKKDLILEKMIDVENELEDIMILSLFATFERELRSSIQDILESNTNKINPTVERLSKLTLESIERWTVSDMIDALKDIVSDNLRGKVKQIYEYRNWVAHGRNQNKLPSSKTDPKTTSITLVDFILQAKAAI